MGGKKLWDRRQELNSRFVKIKENKKLINKKRRKKFYCNFYIVLVIRFFCLLISYLF